MQKAHHKDIDLTEVKHEICQAKGLWTLQSKVNLGPFKVPALCAPGTQ